VSAKVRIAVNGSLGRMGERILALAETSSEFEVVAAFDQKKISGSLSGKGVLIDFSGPAGTLAAIDRAVAVKWGLVIGTTGLEPAAERAIEAASKTIPVVRSGNMSVGVNLMLELVAAASAKLGKDFDIEITEAHHRHKKDAPSGTALMLARAVADAKKWVLSKALRYRKDGKSEHERSHEEIGMQVIRAGEIVGEHTVLFAGPAETIEITHRASSRDTFARGSLEAAKFLSKKQKGLFTMKDVLQ
jgi:4-hydroxy-tetrahydrodipicolinate reductase